MKQLKGILPAAAAITICTAAYVSAADIYVDAVKGTANGNGSLGSPYQTIEQARNAVRSMNTDMKEDINVIIRGGTYFIENTIKLSTQDSGSNGYYVNYRAYPNEEPVINGAKEITGWTIYDTDKNIWKAPAQGIQTRHLYINGQRAVRAKTDKTLTEIKKTDEGFLCDDEWLLDLKKPQDLEFSWVVLWTNPRCGVASITKNAEGRVSIAMKNPGWGYFKKYRSGGQVSVTEPTWMENAYEFLDEPGEFYLDRDTDTFYYIPRDGEILENATVYAPVVEQMLRIEGDNIDNKVHNIRIDGLSFEYSTWNRPSTGSGHHETQCNYIIDPEGAEHRMIDAAVTLRRAENVPVENCVISKIGNIGLKLEDGTQYSDVTGNHIYDISGTGIALGEVIGNAVASTSWKYYCRGNNVRNNLVENVGVDYHSSVGISAGFPMESEISHNEIIGSNYSGMHIGYGWGNYVTTGTNMRDFKITDNIVADTMKSCHDGGGIYTLGATGATEKHRNYISGNYIYNSSYPNGILYADEGSCFWTFENNVIDNYGIERGRWCLIWQGSIHDVNMLNNHTTRKEMTNNGSNCIVDGTENAEDLEWSDEALKIIQNAGLEPEYAAKMKGFNKAEIGKLVLILPENIKKGETIELNYRIKSKGGFTLPTEDCQVDIKSSDTNIITVENNTLKAVGEGSADITITARKDEKEISVTKSIVSDDVIVDLSLHPANPYIALGSGKTVTVEAVTRFGNRITEGLKLTYQSLNPEIASVSSDGKITAYQTGKFTLQIKAEYDGVTIEKDFPYEALRPGDSKELDGFKKYKLTEETKSASGWFATYGTAESDGTGIDLAGTFVTYKDRKFKDELIEFNLNLNGSISWPTITFNNSTYDVCALSPNTNAYLVVIQEKEIELQRWINGTGTMIYGEVAGRITIEKERIKNNYFKSGESAYVQIGTFDEADGVRIILWVNGEKVIDYLDKSDEALRGGGYFGILEQTQGRSMRLSPPEIVVKEAADQGNAFDDLDGHWCKQIVMDLYGQGLVRGVGNKKFAPDNTLTRAEYIAMALRAAQIEPENTADTFFRDNQNGKWYYSVINTALRQGLLDIHLIQDDQIFPDRAITREEMASVAARICNLKKKTNTVSVEEYSDRSSISPWTVKYFKQVCAYGIFQGDEYKNLNPQKTATRAEAVSAIKGIYALNE